jgi:hypothetical protein
MRATCPAHLTFSILSPEQYWVWGKKSKGVPWQAEVVLRVPGRLRPQIISTFGTTRVAGHQLIFRGWVDLRAHGFL